MIIIWSKNREIFTLTKFRKFRNRFRVNKYALKSLKNAQLKISIERL